jgi:hypothetical protein
MSNNQNSLMSKGWLIIGIVLLLTGSYLVFITNSLYFESNQLARSFPNNEDENSIINDVISRISLDAFFLTITSIIIITVGAIMCLEWFLFSKFLQKFSDE